MERALAAGIALCSLLSIGSPAAAASPAATFSGSARVDVVAPSAASPASAANARPRAEALKVIYSSFNTDASQRYDCCTAYSLSTPDSAAGSRQFVGMPFTPVESGSVRKIVLGLAYLSGANGVVVTLREDAEGYPGRVLRRFSVTEMPTFGTCCETESVTANGIPVAAGATYWVVVKALADTYAGWSWNTIGAFRPFAVNKGEGWGPGGDFSAAFAILGD